MPDDPHEEIVALMYDQLDALEQALADLHDDELCTPVVDDWIEETRNLLGPRGKRG